MSKTTEPTVIHTGKGWIALNKPAGWLVHKGTGDAPDLVSWAANHPSLSGHLAPVHRLDEGTSGVVLLATPQARAKLAAMFAAGEMKKTYLALVHGRPHRKGVIRRSLSDARRGRGVDAITRFKTLRWFGKVSFLQIRPETGRKHQIRRHMSGLGYHLVGDTRYGRRGKVPEGAPERLWLHAFRLVMPDGTTIEAPLADELEDHREVLQAEEDARKAAEAAAAPAETEAAAAPEAVERTSEEG
jgi:23S rRNA-/tRNA-specific pseudouridylate synthase